MKVEMGKFQKNSSPGTTSHEPRNKTDHVKKGRKKEEEEDFGQGRREKKRREKKKGEKKGSALKGKLV